MAESTWRERFQYFLDSMVDKKEFPFYADRRDRKKLDLMEVSWHEMCVVARMYLKQYATETGCYMVEVEIGEFVDGEFERTLRVDKIDKRSRMA
jgi:hypothetical protein